jgi:hypothetical protein
MRGLVIRCAVAAVLFTAYWLAWLFDVYRLDYFVVEPLHSVPYYALAMALPCVLLGALIGRWWAPFITLVFIPAALWIPMRCVKLSDDVIGCADFALEDSWIPMVWTAPWLFLGGLIVSFGPRARARPAVAGT